jgi:hypothetical protein
MKLFLFLATTNYYPIPSLSSWHNHACIQLTLKGCILENSYQALEIHRETIRGGLRRFYPLNEKWLVKNVRTNHIK